MDCIWQVVHNLTHELEGHDLAFEVLVEEFEGDLDPLLEDTQLEEFLLEEGVG